MEAIIEIQSGPVLNLAGHIETWRKQRDMMENHRLSLISRQVDSPVEAIVYLWLLDFRDNLHTLTGRDIIVSPQAHIGPYRADFLVGFCGEKIVIECDGHDFHEKTKEQASHDKRRDRDLTLQGFTVLRYTGRDICRDPFQVIRDICKSVGEDYPAVLGV